MSSQAQDLQPGQNDGNLGRGQRKTKPTAKGEAYRNTLSRRGIAQGATPSQTPAQGTTQAQSQDAAQTDRRVTRSQTRGIVNNPDNATSNGTGNRHRRAPISKVKIDGLMTKIYEEIRCAAINKLSSRTNEIYAVREFLFQARLRRFFDLQPEDERENLRRCLEEYDVHHPRGGSVAQDVKRALDFPEPDRLTEFCDGPKLLLLTFCAHSASFRDVIRRSDADSRREGLSRWVDIYPVIESCKSSLELFARCFDFDWVGNLQAFEKHFDTLLRYVYSDERESLEGINQSNFGIGEGDLAETHQIPDEEESYVHHHWALPTEDDQPAVRPTIEYTVTRDMERAPFVNDFYAIVDRPRIRRKAKKAKLPVTLPLGSSLTLKQLDIIRSVILDPSNHTWPPGAFSNVLERPDFCGAAGHKCKACGVAAPDPVDQSKADNETVVIDSNGNAEPEPEHASSPGYPCQCTFNELMELRNDKRAGFTHPDSLLIELFTTNDKGRDIRSLQRIPKDTFIGEYVGEIYPVRDVDTGKTITRYGHPDGNVYHFSVPIGAPPSPGTTDNRPSFTVDSAHLGNWTRFMNHHCYPNVSFYTVNVGQVWTTVIRTVREIKFREEITVHYGPNYFYYRGLDCRCGHARCKLKNVSQGVKSRKRTRFGGEVSGSDSASISASSEEEQRNGMTKFARRGTSTKSKSATDGQDKEDVRPTGKENGKGKGKASGGGGSSKGKSKGKGKAAKKGGTRR
ncbi:hypothetical protein A1O7_03449 [Cladophialophora yegresii CBS 114405]|uniref:SET domain-containing protein n=1 Tax=Cladophialophora yegresii CBS 114405 TaxID=1182544 RepID=W9WDC8_9EURO|nr:uncharacterized protein A1O7_03449 [Cladophialophora yegresii CBS 114405]EXJ63005.1 hypothetical protein A1O7_03449 [Cladophialophora yegresii CBS 114405]